MEIPTEEYRSLIQLFIRAEKVLFNYYEKNKEQISKPSHDYFIDLSESVEKIKKEFGW